ncbi:MAG: hypothetical protein KDI01_03535, partial [Halioglobus sp.]|nr:hypothetical protein [Halioglobus sp.]
VAFKSFAAVDFSWARVAEATPAEHLSLMLPMSDPNLPWLGTLIGVPVLGFYFWCTNQFIVQRVLGARSVAHARWGALFAGFLKLPVLYLMVMPGVMAGILLPNLEKADAVFPTLVSTLLPSGLVGLVMAGLLAAIMSSIDSTLNSASALLTMDFMQPEKRGWSPTRIAWTGRACIVLFMVVAASVSPLIADFPGLFQYLQSALSYLVPPVAVVFMVGLFWPRATAFGAFATLLGGHVVSAILFGLSLSGVLTLHFTIIAGVLTGLSAVIFALANRFGSAASLEQVARFTFHADAAAPDPSLAPWQDYRVFSAVVFALTVILVIVHW